jgi:hypothetical protein
VLNHREHPHLVEALPHLQAYLAQQVHLLLVAQAYSVQDQVHQLLVAQAYSAQDQVHQHQLLVA